MTRYVVKQFNYTDVADQKSFEISRANAERCYRSLGHGDYRTSAFIEADNLNEVFRIGNTETDLVEKIDNFYSVSCGDIIVDTETQIAWLVSPMGFTRLGYDMHFKFEYKKGA